MNGRIYDALLGRFLSADLLIQFPSDLQSFNRYSYVRNNPLTKVDQSGFNETMVYSMVMTQNWVALEKAYGSEKANEIMGNTNLGSAAGTVVGAATVLAFAPTIEAAITAIKTFFSGDDDRSNTPPPPATPSQPNGTPPNTTADDAASNGADSASPAPAPNAEPLVESSPTAPDPGQGTVSQQQPTDTAQQTTAGPGTVTRYMSQGEADEAARTRNIPNYGADGVPRPTHVTTDAPLDSAGEATKRYEITPPTHRVTVTEERVPDLGPAPDGRSTTSGGGSQSATDKLIPIDPEEIKKLNP